MYTLNMNVQIEHTLTISIKHNTVNEQVYKVREYKCTGTNLYCY